MPSADSAFSLLEPEQRIAAPARRSKAAGGRYGRWHLETSVAHDDEGWLLTYLDVITLMLVMMVVMLSVSGPPGGKNGQGLPDTVTPPPDPLATAITSAVQKPTLTPPLPVATAASTDTEPHPAETLANSTPPSPESWDGLKLDLIGQDIAVTPGQDSVRFRISNELLFASGDAQIVNGGHVVLDKLLPTLLADPTLRLVIEGHTDSVPIQTARFPSNWELSTGRAASVARYLIEHGVAPQRVQASGYADMRPMGGKGNPVDRAMNRRVELVLEKSPPGR